MFPLGQYLVFFPVFKNKGVFLRDSSKYYAVTSLLLVWITLLLPKALGERFNISNQPFDFNSSEFELGGHVT